jgi:magnesium-transporting ATPase (P-type)
VNEKRVQGDASETGVIRFVEGLLTAQDTNLDQQRHSCPVFRYIDGGAGGEVECAISFSSEIKFNLVIRDMEAENEGLWVIMKGAPERILSRCSHVLVNGAEMPFDHEQ